MPLSTHLRFSVSVLVLLTFSFSIMFFGTLVARHPYAYAGRILTRLVHIINTNCLVHTCSMRVRCLSRVGKNNYNRGLGYMLHRPVISPLRLGKKRAFDSNVEASLAFEIAS